MKKEIFGLIFLASISNLATFYILSENPECGLFRQICSSYYTPGSDRDNCITSKGCSLSEHII